MDNEKCELTGKNSYERESDALAAAVRSAGQRNTSFLRVYKCNYCFKWHLTSQKG
jgi:hypothetical protein